MDIADTHDGTLDYLALRVADYYDGRGLATRGMRGDRIGAVMFFTDNDITCEDIGGLLGFFAEDGGEPAYAMHE